LNAIKHKNKIFCLKNEIPNNIRTFIVDYLFIYVYNLGVKI